MARESAQMAGQLAFRGRAPQLKLPHFSPLSFFSLSPLLQLKLLAHNFSRLAGLYRGVHDVKGQAAEFLGGGGGGSRARVVRGSTGPSVGAQQRRR